jgi:hypothetical protein
LLQTLHQEIPQKSREIPSDAGVRKIFLSPAFPPPQSIGCGGVLFSVEKVFCRKPWDVD